MDSSAIYGYRVSSCILILPRVPVHFCRTHADNDHFSLITWSVKIELAWISPKKTQKTINSEHLSKVNFVILNHASFLQQWITEWYAHELLNLAFFPFKWKIMIFTERTVLYLASNWIQHHCRNKVSEKKKNPEFVMVWTRNFHHVASFPTAVIKNTLTNKSNWITVITEFSLM